jgi:hypothetical protein
MKPAIIHCVLSLAMSLIAALPVFATPQTQAVSSPDLRGIEAERLNRHLLERLENLQNTDGSWGPMIHSISATTAETLQNYHVSTTSFAILALHGSGSTMSRGRYMKTIRNGVAWLRKEQNMSTGMFSNLAGNEALVAQAVATLAMSEVYCFTKSPLMKRSARKGLDAILHLQRPHQAWPATTSEQAPSDVLTTSWMLHALIIGQDCKIAVPETSLDCGLEWLSKQPGNYAGSRWMFLQLLRSPPKDWDTKIGPPQAQQLGERSEQIRLATSRLSIPNQDGQLERGYYLTHARMLWNPSAWRDGHQMAIADFHARATPSALRPLAARTAALQALILQAKYRYSPQYPRMVKVLLPSANK